MPIKVIKDYKIVGDKNLVLYIRDNGRSFAFSERLALGALDKADILCLQEMLAKALEIEHPVQEKIKYGER